jgi:hypothetical protein
VIRRPLVTHQDRPDRVTGWRQAGALEYGS